MSSLPPSDAVPNITDLLDLSKNNIITLCSNRTYLRTVSGLILRTTQLTRVCDNIVGDLRQGLLQTLDLSDNRITKLPKEIKFITSFTDIQLSGNPFVCNCDMLWMRDWMANFTYHGRRVVSDYYQVKCNDGVPVHKLNAVKMGCFPKELTLWEKVPIGLSAVVIVVVVIAIIAISRRWNEVEWFMYLHFDILNKNDGQEDLNNVVKDALISYR